MSNPTSNFGWQMPTNTDLVSQLPADFEVFGQAVDTSLADLKGGTTGQVLKKNTNTDMDFVWSSDTGFNNPMTTTGDTIYSSSGSTPARLGIGSSGQVLTVSGGVPSWATPAAGGKLLQVVSATTTTSKTISNNTYTDTNLTATITPTSASSKILVLVSQYYTMERSANGVNGGIILLRGATILLDDSNKENLVSYAAGATAVYSGTSLSLSYLDSPATTSATTYKTQGTNLHSTGQVIIFQRQSVPSTITLMEIGA